MVQIKAKDVMQLREKTGLPMMECKKALEETGGDEKKALKILQSRGAAKAEKKSERETKAGLIEAYSHDGRIGVLVEMDAETDFVTRNEEFKALIHDIALQIAAMNPKDAADLLAQPFIKDQAKTIGDLINEKVAKIGEKITVARFARFEVGE